MFMYNVLYIALHDRVCIYMYIHVHVHSNIKWFDSVSYSETYYVQWVYTVLTNEFIMHNKVCTCVVYSEYT